MAQVQVFVLRCPGVYTNSLCESIQAVSKLGTYWFPCRTGPTLKINIYLARGARNQSLAKMHLKDGVTWGAASPILDSFLHMVHFIWYKQKNSVSSSMWLARHTFQLIEFMWHISHLLTKIKVLHQSPILSFPFCVLYLLHYLLFPWWVTHGGKKSHNPRMVFLWRNFSVENSPHRMPLSS